jgi:hypothetical protein
MIMLNSRKIGIEVFDSATGWLCPGSNSRIGLWAGWSLDGEVWLQVLCRSKRVAPLPYRYLGADDQVGSNDTGQPAVNSHYERSEA